MMIDTTETSLAIQWFHLERITGTASAVRKEKQMVPDLNVDWEKLEHFARIGLLSIGCALLESAQLKGKDEHIRLLFEIRNALIHNNGDLALNHNQQSLTNATKYIEQNRHTEISEELDSTYFSMNGTVVELDRNISYVLRLFMIKYA
jgi:hypothetical protein